MTSGLPKNIEVRRFVLLLSGMGESTDACGDSLARDGDSLARDCDSLARDAIARTYTKCSAFCFPGDGEAWCPDLLKEKYLYCGDCLEMRYKITLYCAIRMS